MAGTAKSVISCKKKNQINTKQTEIEPEKLQTLTQLSLPHNNYFDKQIDGHAQKSLVYQGYNDRSPSNFPNSKAKKDRNGPLSGHFSVNGIRLGHNSPRAVLSQNIVAKGEKRVSTVVPWFNRTMWIY